MSDAHLHIIQNGRMASIANEYLGKIIEKKKFDILNQMKMFCRNGEHDVTKYASAVSAMNALDDLQMDIRRQIDTANNKEKEVMNGTESG